MPDGASLLLSDALVQWSDPALVEAVRKAEQNYTHPEVCGFYRDRPTLIQLSADTELVAGLIPYGTCEIPPFATLDGAWSGLVRSFRRRFVDGRLFLQGIAIRPKAATAPAPILGAWVAGCSFDFIRDQVVIGKKVYGGVTVSRTPAVPVSTNSGARSVAPEPITAENVRQLTDDEVVLLLGEYNRRVIEGPDAKLMAPVKTSLMPLVAGKMRHRAASGALLPLLRDEARYLAEWNAGKLPTHQTPTAATIERVLRGEYVALRRRSKAEIQSSER